MLHRGQLEALDCEEVDPGSPPTGGTRDLRFREGRREEKEEATATVELIRPWAG